MATPHAATATADATEAPPAKKKSKKPLLIAAVVVVLLGAGAGAWFAFGGKHEAATGDHPEAKAEHKPAVFVPLENFTVNLHDKDTDHYLQVGVTLEVDDAAVQAALNELMPVLRGKLLLLLSSQQSDHLLTLEGKLALAGEIKKIAADVLGDKGKSVQAVHFSSFVIQ